jgi:hypothetical protein
MLVYHIDQSITINQSWHLGPVPSLCHFIVYYCGGARVFVTVKLHRIIIYLGPTWQVLAWTSVYAYVNTGQALNSFS